MRHKIFSFLFVLISFGATAQSYVWTTTPSPNVYRRFEDLYFLNPDTGFAVNCKNGGSYGTIIKTVNGGNSWIKVLDSTRCQFRDIGFTDNQHGWVGTIEQPNNGADTNIMYKTIDGGTTWSGVSNLPGPDTAGICGMKVINDSTLYAVGRYFGPAGFYKTTNNGQTWSYIDLNPLVKGLVDLYFFNADTGYAIGTSGPQYDTGYGRILYTTDGGNTWSIVFTSSQVTSLGWKIVFPSRKVGYVSLQFFNFPNSIYFIKTLDGGLTWFEIPYFGGPANGYDVEGIGFLNDTIGWVGGSTNVYFTNNGGASWTLQTWGDNLNRFQFISDTLAYSAGKKIYKMRLSPAGIVEVENKEMLQLYPNPANDLAYFEFALDKTMRAKLSVYDMSGKEVELVFDKVFEAGNQNFAWQPKNLAPGIYMCMLTYGNHILKHKLEIFK